MDDNKYKLLLDPSLNKFPLYVNLEIYRGHCPCRCVHCPVGVTPPHERNERFQIKHLDFQLFKTVIDEMARHPQATLKLHSVGEPTLWNNFTEGIAYAQRQGVKQWLFTCAVTEDTRLLESMCENIDIVEVSINSIDPEHYKETKGIDAFHTVMKNIRYMREHITRKKINHRLLVSRVATDDPEGDEEFVKYWRASGLVDHVFIRKYIPINEGMKHEKKKNHPCIIFWVTLNINAEGQSVVCFNHLFEKQVNPRLLFGTIKSQAIEEIWNGAKLTAMRAAELSGDYSKLDCGDLLACPTCPSCRSLYSFGKEETSEWQVGLVSPLR